MAERISMSVGSRLELRDYLGMFMMRLGIGRNSYRVMPGLYNTGKPDRSSPVFVSANYKMSFDILRRELAGMNAWILVLDTRGVNVWCAAGKKTFSTDEVVRMVKEVELDGIVGHKELILPQLSAPGVSAYEVHKKSGFKAIFGPVRANDIKSFMDNNKKADKQMRVVTFTTWERFALTPMELTSRILTSFYVVAAIFIISALGQNAWYRAIFGTSAYFIGLIAGAFVTPLVLPYLPWRSFSIKGAFTGFVLTSVFCILFHEQLDVLTLAAMLLFSTAVSSYTSLTFTGATPFTSPSGVEKEMRRAIPIQLAAVVLSLVLWLL